MLHESLCDAMVEKGKTNINADLIMIYHKLRNNIVIENTLLSILSYINIARQN